MLCLQIVLVNVGVLPKDVPVHPAAHPSPADEARPQTLALVAFLAELNNRRLLMVSAERAGVLPPLGQAFGVKVVLTQNRDDSFVIRFEADGAD